MSGTTIIAQISIPLKLSPDASIRPQKLIAILIPGWSRADYLVEPNQIYIYIIYLGSV